MAGYKKVMTMVKPGKNISGTERGTCKCAEADQFRGTGSMAAEGDR